MSSGKRPPTLSKALSRTELSASGDEGRWKVAAVKDGVQEPLAAPTSKWKKVSDIFTTSKKKSKGAETAPAKFIRAAKLSAAGSKISKEGPRDTEEFGASIEDDDSVERHSPPTGLSSPTSPASRVSHPKMSSPVSLSEFKKPWPAPQKGGHTHKMVLKAYLERDVPEEEMDSVIGAIKLRCEDKPSFAANGQSLLLTHKKTSAGDAAPLHSSRNPESRTFFMQVADSQSLQQWMLEIVLGIERHNSSVALKTAEDKAAALALALKNAKSKNQRILNEQENMKILLSTEQEAHYNAQQQLVAMQKASNKMDQDMAFVRLSRFKSRIFDETSTKAAAFAGMFQYRAARKWMLRASDLFLRKRQVQSERRRFDHWRQTIARQRQIVRVVNRGARNLAARTIFAWQEEISARHRFRRNNAVAMLFRSRRVARLVLAVILSLSFNAAYRKSKARKLASARAKFQRRALVEWAMTAKERKAVAIWRSHIFKKAQKEKLRKTIRYLADLVTNRKKRASQVGSLLERWKCALRCGAWELWNCWLARQGWRRRAVARGRRRGGRLEMRRALQAWSETAGRARQVSRGMQEKAANTIQHQMAMVFDGWASVVEEWMRCSAGLFRLLSSQKSNQLRQVLEGWGEHSRKVQRGLRKERWCRRLLCRLSASRTMSSWREVASNMAKVKAATHNRLCMRRLSRAMAVWKSYWGWERGLQRLQAARWHWETLEPRAENSVAPHGPGEAARDSGDRYKSPAKPKSLSALWGVGTEGWRPAGASSPSTRRAWESGGRGVPEQPKGGKRRADKSPSAEGRRRASEGGEQGAGGESWRDTVGGKLAVGLDEEFRKVSTSCWKGKARQILLAMAGECGRRAFCERKTRGAERRRQLWISRQVWSTWAAVCFNLPLQRTDGLPVWGSTPSPTAPQRQVL